MRLDNLGVPWGTGPFRRTKRISFELSNVCNLAQQHKQCPLHLAPETTVLPATVVTGVLECCKKHDFQGVFAFHLYNEPGIDPRLVYFMHQVKAALPRARLFLLTNGWYLTQSLAEELVGHGLDYLGISAYSQKEYERLVRIHLPIPIRLIKQVLDDRLEWYPEEDLLPRLERPCWCPLYEICITCKGEVVLCPYDWQRRHVFGNLRSESLEAILQRDEIWKVYDDLAAGRRTLDICVGCKTSRGEPYIPPVNPDTPAAPGTPAPAGRP